MQAEIISIGDELASGQRLDTNSQWLSQQLGELGIAVAYHTTVGDDLARNVEVFRRAAQRVQIVVATGGLGPTADDLTREALAQAAGVELVLNEPSLEHIRAIFSRRARPMPERNVVQAMFPRGSQPIHNPEGTAPGIAITLEAGGGACRVFALPGVPAEMQQMWAQSVAPEIRRLAGVDRVIRHRAIRCFGAGESDIEQMLPDLIRRGREPSVGITASQATITLRITAAGATDEECFARMTPTLETIRQCLGPLVFGEGEEELEDAVVRLLATRGETLATAEWGSAGAMARWVAVADPTGAAFCGGLTVASLATLQRVLGSPASCLHDADPSGPEVAAALADTARERLGADYGLALAAFPPATDDREPRMTHFALSAAHETVTQPVMLAGHSAIVEARVAKQVLNFLRLWLLNAGKLG